MRLSTILRYSLLFAIFGTRLGASAQRTAQVVHASPVDSVLSRFEHNQLANAPSAVDEAYEIVFRRDVAVARKDSLLGGLERLSTQSSNANVRNAAVRLLAHAGEPGRGAAMRPHVMARLLRIYHAQPQTDCYGVRSTIRDVLPSQSERAAAITLLREVAAAPDPNGPDPVHGYFSVGDPRTHALGRLMEMGEAGRGALQAMHRSGEARSPQARLILDQMAQRGFPVTDAWHDTVPRH